MKQTAFSPVVVATLALAVLTVLTACNSDSRPRDLMMEEAYSKPVERPIAMKGDAVFLDGKLGVLATVTRGFDRPRRADGRRPLNEDEIRRGRREGTGMTDVYTIMGDSEEEQKEAMEEYIRSAKARRAAGSPMPPVTLRVQLDNRGTDPLEVEVTEVNSELGNFAVRPAKLTVAPGQSATLDPMISQLGVTSDEIPLKVAVRVAGKKEAQVVAVKNVLAPNIRKELEARQK